MLHSLDMFGRIALATGASEGFGAQYTKNQTTAVML